MASNLFEIESPGWKLLVAGCYLLLFVLILLCFILIFLIDRKLVKVRKLIFLKLNISSPEELHTEALLRNDYFYLRRLLTKINSSDDLETVALKQEFNGLMFKIYKVSFGILCLVLAIGILSYFFGSNFK